MVWGSTAELFGIEKIDSHTNTRVSGLAAFVMAAWRASFSSQSIGTAFVQPSSPDFQLDQSKSAMPHLAAKVALNGPVLLQAIMNVERFIS